MKNIISFLIAVIIWSASTACNPAFAQGTAFTYQGRLNLAGSPANGIYDMKLSLFDTNTGGIAVAGPLTNSPVVVSNGLFTTLLDFGPAAFNGGAVWLEIGVRASGGGGFVTLSPRQQLTPTPSAIFAENATALANGVALGNAIGNVIQPNALYSFIGGGMNNQAASEWSVIGGGDGNVINADPTGSPTVASTIGGGLMNSSTASYATVAGGFGNLVSGMYGAIGGGSNNVASGYASVVGGGDPNYALAPFSSVLGGNHNSASGDHATVGGGSFNGAFGTGSTVGGGEQNYSHGDYATIGGGEQNSANGTEATVAGGTGNIASGDDSTVPGGIYNVASGYGSFAAGVGANAINIDSFVWADGEAPFGSSEFSDRDHQFKVQAKNGVVMDVSGSSGVNPAALFVNSTAPSGVGLYVIQTNSTDAAVVINSCSSRSSSSGGGDILKGFGWTPGGFGSPNQLVFEVTVLGDVYGHSFTSTSDRNAKEHFASISPSEILRKVASLPISQWNFKGEQQDVEHIGPMAQDFHAAFGLNGAEDKRISLTDEGGVALAAIQGLNQKMETDNAELRAENADLKQRLAALEQIVLRQKSN